MTHNPTDNSAWRKLADAHRSSGQYPEAIAAYEKCLEIAPFNSWAYNALAECYRNVGRYETSLEMFEKALEKNPTAEAWAGAGVAYKASGEHEKAIECFQNSVDINSTIASCRSPDRRRKPVLTPWARRWIPRRSFEFRDVPYMLPD